MDVDEVFDQKELQNGQELLDILNVTLKSVGDSLNKVVQQVPEALLNPVLDKELQITLKDVDKLYELLSKNVPSSVSVKEEDKSTTSQIECEILREQLESQTNELKKAQEEIEQLRNQTLNQSTFCASLGAVLGNLAWRASKFPQVVDAWLFKFQEKVGTFLSIANGTLVAFINTYDEFPPVSNVEYQFVMGLLGIATNISASPEGRQYLIVHPNGGDLVRNIIEFMPKIVLSPGSFGLLRLMAMILYNVSMNKSGLQRLLELRVGSALSHCLKADAVPAEMQALYLRVLQSVTYDLTEPEYIRDVTTSVPLNIVEDIAASGQDEASTLAKDVLKQLRTLRRAT